MSNSTTNHRSSFQNNNNVIAKPVFFAGKARSLGWRNLRSMSLGVTPQRHALFILKETLEMSLRTLFVKQSPPSVSIAPVLITQVS